jgi:phosphomannomutase/phosphomannomutase/phosphoglucomutase
MVYFAVKHHKTDGGIMVTASHNPMDYNGMKLVQQGARPISGDTGLRDIEEQVVTGDFSMGQCSDIVKGSYISNDMMKPYVEHLLTYIDTAKLSPLKIVVNAGNG